MRLVCLASSLNNKFVCNQFKGHNLTVIATDGAPIEPIVVDSLVTLPGERYDVILDATTPTEISKIQQNLNVSLTI